MAYCIKLSSYTPALTTITTLPKGMEVKFSEDISKNFCCTDENRNGRPWNQIGRKTFPGLGLYR